MGPFVHICPDPYPSFFVFGSMFLHFLVDVAMSVSCCASSFLSCACWCFLILYFPSLASGLVAVTSLGFGLLTKGSIFWDFSCIHYCFFHSPLLLRLTPVFPVAELPEKEAPENKKSYFICLLRISYHYIQETKQEELLGLFNLAITLNRLGEGI